MSALSKRRWLSRSVGGLRAEVIEFARMSVSSTREELETWEPEDVARACPVLDSLQDVYAFEMRIRRSQIRRFDMVYRLHEQAMMVAMMKRLRALALSVQDEQARAAGIEDAAHGTRIRNRPDEYVTRADLGSGIPLETLVTRKLRAADRDGPR